MATSENIRKRENVNFIDGPLAAMERLKSERKTMVNSRFNPDDGLSSFTEATKLLEKRKEMVEVQNQLEAKREEIAQRLELIKKKEKSLEEKRNALTDDLIQLDKSIRV